MVKVAHFFSYLAIIVFTASALSAGVVDDAQRMLNRLGYNAGPVDGAYGNKTRSALEKFYANQGDKFDGKLDNNELVDLQNALSEKGLTSALQTTFELQQSFIVNPSKQDLILEMNISSNKDIDKLIWFDTDFFRGDFNGDGINDVIVTGTPADAMHSGKWEENAACRNSADASRNLIAGDCAVDFIGKPIMFWGVGKGKYSRADTRAFINDTGRGYFTPNPLIADFNKDGIADVWVLESGPSWEGGPDHYYLSNGDGTWTHSNRTQIRKDPGNTFAHGGAVGDIDGDGDIDVVTTGKGKGLHCYFNNGSGKMTHKKCNRNFIGYTITLADFDGDGDLDAFAGGNSYEGTGGIGQYGGGSYILRNNGKGSFSKSHKFPQVGCWVTNPKSWTVDIDDDGDQDVIKAIYQNWYTFSGMQVLENLGNNKWNMHTYPVVTMDSFKETGGSYTKSGTWRSYEKIKKTWSTTDTCEVLFDGLPNFNEGHELNQGFQNIRHVDVDGDGRKDVVLFNPGKDVMRDVMYDRIHGAWFKNTGDAGAMKYYKTYEGGQQYDFKTFN